LIRGDRERTRKGTIRVRRGGGNMMFVEGVGDKKG